MINTNVFRVRKNRKHMSEAHKHSYKANKTKYKKENGAIR